MVENFDPATWMQAAGAAIAGFAGGVIAFRNKWSDSSVETARNNAEIDILRELQEQLKGAYRRVNQAEEARLKAHEEMLGLRQQIAILEHSVTESNRLVQSLREEIERLTQVVQDGK